MNIKFPSSNKDPERKRIGQWISTIRQKYHQGKLSRHWIDKFEQTFPEWSWDPFADRWNRTYKELVIFCKKEGKFPFQKSKTAKEKHLAAWVETQYAAYRGIVTYKLSQERIVTLEQIPGWTWTPSSDQWGSTYEELKVFVSNKKRFPSKNGNKEEKSLAVWARTQRELRKKNKLAQIRIEKLKQMPEWSWDPFTDQWAETYKKFLTFCKKHKRVPNAGSKNQSEKALGKWVTGQRKKKNKLSQDRITKLERVAIWSWNPFADQWDINCAKMQAFVKQEGKLPSQHSRNPKERFLGIWTSNQRKTYSKRKLSQTQIDRLEHITKWSWSPNSGQWDTTYQELATFVKVNRRFPSKSKDNKEQSLANWVKRQRMIHKNNRLSQKQIEKLEAISGWDWEPLTSQWNTTYKRLVAFVKKRGKIPNSSSKYVGERIVGKWSIRQRASHKKGRLPQSQIIELESIPGFFKS